MEKKGGLKQPASPRACSPKLIFSNMGICALLIGYTLLGAFVFLALEGSYSEQHFAQPNQELPPQFNVSALPSLSSMERWASLERNRTVDAVWEITVSLNILYEGNWTRLASVELLRFQEALFSRFEKELAAAAHVASKQVTYVPPPPAHWSFGRAFLFALTTLTTIGYGRVGPRTTLGRVVVIVYAVLGIPLTLLYLSSIGALLARCARLCCARLCSQRTGNKAKIQHKSGTPQAKSPTTGDEPFFLHPSELTNSVHMDGDILTAHHHNKMGTMNISDRPISLTPNSTMLSTHSPLPDVIKSNSIYTSAVACTALMALYVIGGAVVLARWENWTFAERVYFCFMTLSTVGFGDLIPGEIEVQGAAVTASTSALTSLNDTSSSSMTSLGPPHLSEDGSEWFCAIYILVGMALTAMSFNLCHDEMVQQSSARRRQLYALS